MDQVTPIVHLRWESLPGEDRRVQGLAFRLANVGSASRWAWYVVGPLLVVMVLLGAFLQIRQSGNDFLFLVILAVVSAIFAIQAIRKSRLPHKPCALELLAGPDGLTTHFDTTSLQLAWQEVKDITPIEEYLAIRSHRAGLALFIPDRAFASPEQRERLGALFGEYRCQPATPPPLSYSFTYGWLDFLSASRASLFSKFLPALFLAMTIWMMATRELPARQPVYAMAMFFGAMLLISYGMMATFLATQQWWAARRAGAAQQFAYDESSLEFQGSGLAAKCAWRELRYYKMTRRCYIIWSRPGTAVIIPRRAFPSIHEQTRFESLLHRKLKPSYRYIF